MPKPTVSKVFLKLSRIIESGANTDIVMKKLDELESEHSPSYNLQKMIIKTCCDLYDVKPSEILTPSYVKKKDLPPRNLCVVLIRHYFPDYSNSTIGNIFFKSNVLVSQVMNDFNKMSTKIKHERVFLQKYERAREIIDRHIKN